MVQQVIQSSGHVDNYSQFIAKCANNFDELYRGMANAEYLRFSDDFSGAGQAYGTTPIDGWRSRKGSDGACVDWTVTPVLNGVALGTIGNTTASMAVSGIQLDRSLTYRASQGGLSLECRLKFSRITQIAVFVGFTDQVSALEMPANSAASAHTITTTLTDGCGLLFDTDDTSTDQWMAVGVANDVDATHQFNLAAGSTALLPVADTYETFRVDLSTAGVASFYRNGTQIGSSMTGATTPSVLLTPVVAAFNRTTTGAPTVSVDYMNISALRA